MEGFAKMDSDSLLSGVLGGSISLGVSRLEGNDSSGRGLRGISVSTS